MNRNAQLIEKLYTSLDQHDHHSMAECYHPRATFQDIAFKLDGKNNIHSMWAMICRPESDLRAKLESAKADNSTGTANVVDTYTMSDTGRRVVNPITSHFKFKDGLIVEQRDVCDAVKWAEQAFGGV